MYSPIPNLRLMGVSMYVDILSSALDDWVTDLAGHDLVSYAVLCRQEMRSVAPRGVSAYSALASEIAYDRALIALCTERGIDAHATSFNYPSSERRRLEVLLAQDGVDLEAPLQRRPRTRSLPRPKLNDADGVRREWIAVSEEEHAPSRSW